MPTKKKKNTAKKPSAKVVAKAKPKAKKLAPVPLADQPWYKKWLTKHNANRRKDYSTDEAYRKTIIDKSRKAYRNKADVRFVDCRDNLGSLDEIGSIRNIMGKYKKVSAVLTFNRVEAAEALMSSPVVVYRWQQDGRLPKPLIKTFYATKSGSPILLYSQEEIEAAISVLGPHQAEVRHYRATHVDTKAAMQKAFNKVRGKN